MLGGALIRRAFVNARSSLTACLCYVCAGRGRVACGNRREPVRGRACCRTGWPERRYNNRLMWWRCGPRTGDLSGVCGVRCRCAVCVWRLGLGTLDWARDVFGSLCTLAAFAAFGLWRMVWRLCVFTRTHETRLAPSHQCHTPRGASVSNASSRTPKPELPGGTAYRAHEARAVAARSGLERAVRPQMRG